MRGSTPTLLDQTPPPGISQEDWAVTPVAVRVLVMELLQRVAKLEARLNQTAQNSSKPPSSEPTSAPPRQAKAPRAVKRADSRGIRGAGLMSGHIC
jgi:hypothetical protein